MLSTLLLAAEEGEGLHFPAIGELIEWPAFLFEDTIFAFNKIGLIAVLATVFTLGIFFAAGRKRALVPTGVQNVAEASLDFIREGIVLQAMGPNGLGWVPFLTCLFFFVFWNNIFEVVPAFQMPATARMAIPLLLAALVWVLYNAVGVIKQGPLGYLKSSLFPPGVPTALYLLVTPIEFVSNFIVRPFSLAVRLFANMLAGHLLLVTFAVLSTALIQASQIWLKPVFLASFALLVFLTLFEVLVSVLQAYIFTILTAVYIGGSMEAHH